MQKRLKVHTLIIYAGGSVRHAVPGPNSLDPKAMSLKSYLNELLHDQSLGLALLTEPTLPTHGPNRSQSPLDCAAG
jgi:hypothetical protein